MTNFGFRTVDYASGMSTGCDELVSGCGLGTTAGLEGANCYHERYPFIPGISERQWSNEWLTEQNRKEDTPVTFKGKEYTAYEARQRHRYPETNMRAQRQKVELLQKAGADPDDVMLARCKYQAQLDEYKSFSKKMGLPEQRERIYYDMKGRVAPSKETYQAYLAGNIHGSKEKRLQEQLTFVYNGRERLIPLNTTLSNVKTIAGKGSKDILNDAQRLAAIYGGKPDEWSKRVGKTVSDVYEFDIHWYERNYIMYEIKVKHVKERKP